MNKRPVDMEYHKFLHSAVEVIPERLYFVTFKRNVSPTKSKNSHYFRADTFMRYDGFYNDFGPYNICNVYHYCKYLNKKLEDARTNNYKVVQYASLEKEKRLNAAYLIGAYAIIYLNKTAEEMIKSLTHGDTQPYGKYHDASVNLSEYKISLPDCLRAIEKAKKYGFFNFADFNYTEYEHYENVETGDLNWILPGKFIAFCGPHQQASSDSKGYTLHAPSKYFQYFRSNRVTSVVRLNYKFYEASLFTDAGFQHHDLIFRDGSTPSDLILNQFLDICEQTEGGVAVHCKAGLGRTGSLIGAYIMKHYRLSAVETIAWLRICRPGSVIGHQQQWMEEKMLQMWQQGDAMRKENDTPIHVHSSGIYSYENCSLITEEIINDYNMNPMDEEQVSEESESSDTEQEDFMLESIVSQASVNKTPRSRSVISGISKQVDTLNINDNHAADQRDRNGNFESSTSTSHVSVAIARNRKLAELAAAKKGVNITTPASKNKCISSLIKKIPTTSAPAAKLCATNTVTQGDELNQIKSRRAAAAAHIRAQTVATNQSNQELLQSSKQRHHNRAKSQTVRSTTNAATTTTPLPSTVDIIPSQTSSPTKAIHTLKSTPRLTYLVLRTSSKDETSTLPTNGNEIGTTKGQIFKNKNETTKRASVRRTPLGRSKMTRASLSSKQPATPENVANSTPEKLVDSPSLDDSVGPITRSRNNISKPTTHQCGHNCGGCSEQSVKRGKRSLSSSRLNDKIKLSRKTQSLAAGTVPTTNSINTLNSLNSLKSSKTMVPIASPEHDDYSCESTKDVKEQESPNGEIKKLNSKGSVKAKKRENISTRPHKA